MSFFGPGTGFTQPVDPTPASGSANDLSKLPTIAGEASKPAAIANKVSTVPDKADKIGTAVNKNLLFFLGFLFFQNL